MRITRRRPSKLSSTSALEESPGRASQAVARQGARRGEDPRQGGSRLAKVDDPRAAPMLWQVFAADDRHHLLLARLLGPIKSPKASRMPGRPRVFTATTRRPATPPHKAVRERDPAEFAEPLIALVSQPLKYKTTGAAGLGGSQMRVLEVEDEQFNRQLVYAILPTMSSRPPIRGTALGAARPTGLPRCKLPIERRRSARPRSRQRCSSGPTSPWSRRSTARYSP